MWLSGGVNGKSEGRGGEGKECLCAFVWGMGLGFGMGDVVLV